VVVWLTLLLRIQEVLGSILCLDTDCRDRFFVVFSVPLNKCWDGTSKLGHDLFLPHPFLFIIHLPPLHSTLYNMSHWKRSLNELQTNNKQYLGMHEECHGRSHWPRGLRRRSAAAWLLGSRARIPVGAWMFVSCVYMLCCPVYVEVSATSWSLIQRSPIVCLILCD
jgi:hypothetical protein